MSIRFFAYWFRNAIIVTPAVLGVVISSTVLLLLRVLILPFAMLEAWCQEALKRLRQEGIR